MRILRLFAAALILLLADSMQAQTQIHLTKQVKDVLPATNGGVSPGVATGSVLVSSGTSDPAVYQTKLGYDVRDAAGVDCTGTSDSTTAFAAWLASVPNSSRIDIGSCRIRTGPIVLYARSNLHFVGAENNAACSSGAAGGFYWNGRAGGGTLFLVNRSSDIFFEGLTFQSLVTRNGPDVMLDIDETTGSGTTTSIRGDRLCISTNEAAHAGFVGIRIANTSASNVEDNHFTNTTVGCGNGRSGQVGFQIGGSGGGANSFNDTFEGGEGMNGCAIDFNLLRGSQIRIADTLGGGQESVHIQGAASVQLINNRWEDTTLTNGYAIDFSDAVGGSYLEMRGNTIAGPGGRGAVFNGPTLGGNSGLYNLVLSGNYFYNFTSTFVSGIVISNSSAHNDVEIGPNKFPDTPNWVALAGCGTWYLGTNCAAGWQIWPQGITTSTSGNFASDPLVLAAEFWNGSSNQSDFINFKNTLTSGANPAASLILSRTTTSSGAFTAVDFTAAATFKAAAMSATGQIGSTLATGTAPLSITSTTPVANLTLSNHPQVYEAGVLTASEKIYTNTQALTTGSATHTFANSFSFTSSSTFGCTCTDQTTANACKAVPASATTVTLAGNGSDVLWLSCSGH